MIWPVVAYAPTAATMPSIAAQPLNLSASLFMCLPIGWICVFVLNALLEVTPAVYTLVSFSFCHKVYAEKMSPM